MPTTRWATYSSYDILLMMIQTDFYHAGFDLLATAFTWDSHSTYSSTLKMEAICSFETSLSMDYMALYSRR
jgi:hypothetical protein